ncbi:glycosyltransferase [Bacteroides muris (ex Fokt et al. 2023)]|uniref:Glycosyltransferase n=1 Tax=Bacteroides muris (ex Fokt et al. 2023) TaxID=2937417 RepID=A0A9X2NWH4_9BACE|nr:glycosyltransferase [Bacteroides muris (ex Fokt et al. 2023)]MCR6506017.1 glycosyltransferase [Bacteroides muris (ex Fokt et al. 2023)]
MTTLPNYFNTIIVVITYNPGPGFKNQIERYVEIADKTIIVDNGSAQDVALYIPKDLDKHFVVVKSSQNRGIAWGLNQGVLYAKNNNYLYLLSFDQDSLPIHEILDCYADVLCHIDNIGLIGTCFTEQKVIIPSNITYSSKKTLITSGTLHSVKIFDEIGLYDEQLFIDSVDFDFVLRVRKKYRVLCVNQPLIYHELGSPITKYGITSSNHSAIRRYYMSRNHLLISKRYWKNYPLWVLKKNVLFFCAIIKMILVENNMKEKLLHTVQGLRDAFNLR